MASMNYFLNRIHSTSFSIMKNWRSSYNSHNNQKSKHQIRVQSITWSMTILVDYTRLQTKDKYRITVVLKVKTDIITNIAVSPIGWVWILVIMHVETFKTDIIVFISIKHHNVMSHWPIFSSIRVTKLILTISLGEIKGKMSTLMIK